MKKINEFVQKLLDSILGSSPTYVIVLHNNYKSVALYHTKIKWLANRKFKYYTNQYNKDGLVDIELIKL